MRGRDGIPQGLARAVFRLGYPERLPEDWIVKGEPARCGQLDDHGRTGEDDDAAHGLAGGETLTQAPLHHGRWLTEECCHRQHPG